MSYSSQEVSRVKDFAQFTEEELERAKAMIAALDVGPRHAADPALDARPRQARPICGAWSGGTSDTAASRWSLPTRDRASKRRPLVLICDVSGSMERYARMLLHFIHSLAGGLDRVEAFLFATRLTRITREIARRGVDDAVPDVPRRRAGLGRRHADRRRAADVQRAMGAAACSGTGRSCC